MRLEQPARRIVSLVPSLTELLADLGLSERVVGITRFCNRPPEWRKGKTRIGGTKDADVERIRKLRPDLVIANKEENLRETIEAIRGFCAVWTSDISNLEDALAMIRDVGLLTGTAEGARAMIERIGETLPIRAATPSAPRVAYLIWQDPLMSVGHDTFIHEMLRISGFENVFADRRRYPVISREELTDARADIILLSSEPYPFRRRDADAFSERFPHSRVERVEGDMFSWYGSRLLQSGAYLRELRDRLIPRGESPDGVGR